MVTTAAHGYRKQQSHKTTVGFTHKINCVTENHTLSVKSKIKLCNPGFFVRNGSSWEQIYKINFITNASGSGGRKKVKKLFQRPLEVGVVLMLGIF